MNSTPTDGTRSAGSIQPRRAEVTGHTFQASRRSLPSQFLLRPFLRPASWAIGALIGGIPIGAKAQFTNAVPATPDPYALASSPTTFESRSIPVAPWLSTSTPAQPDWLEESVEPTPFRLPGLGTASIGSGNLPAGVGVPRRNRRTPSKLIPAGPFDIHFGLAHTTTYGNGLLTAPGQTESTFQHNIVPTMTIYAGDRWTVAYSPRIGIFSADGYQNTLDHTVVLGGSASWRNWEFGLNHASAVSSTPLVETGRQTDQTTHSTGLNGRLDLNGKDSITLGLSQNIRFADGAPDMYSWSTDNWYDHGWTDTLFLGLGLGGGYDFLDPGVDMPYQRLNARIRGQLGSKVSYSVSGGAEVRQFSGSEASAKISPLVSVSAAYQVLRRTSLTAGFDHSVGTSFFTDQLTENSSIYAGVSQRLSDHWSVSVNGGYRKTRYEEVQDERTTEREDGSIFVTSSVNWQVLSRLSISLAHSFRQNDSDRTTFSFDSHQYSVRLSYSM